MAAFIKFHQFAADLAAGVHNLKTGTTHQFKVFLTNTAVNPATQAVKADLTEIAAGNGYTAGGALCAHTSGGQTSGTFKLVLADPATWTAGPGTIGPFRYAVFYNDTPTIPADPLIGAWDFGEAVTLVAGAVCTVDLDQTNGVLVAS